MSFKKDIALLTTMFLAHGSSHRSHFGLPLPPNINADGKQSIDPIIPAGCREFSFDDGEFTCIALNQKSADRKYKNWKNQNL